MKGKIKAKIIQAINETDIEGYVRLQNGTGSFDSEGMQKEIVGRVWNAVMVDNNAFDGKPVKPEEVVLALRRKGVPAADIIYRKNKFLVKLPNATFNIYRSPEGDFRAFAISGSGRSARTIGMEPEKFASLLLEFDSEVPEIKRQSSELVRKIKQTAIARKMQELTVNLLVGEAFKDEKLTDYSVNVSNDGTVTVCAKIIEVREQSISVPLESLGEKLNAMKSELHTMTPEILDNDNYSEQMFGYRRIRL